MNRDQELRLDSKMKRLFTIGYEAATVPEFLKVLQLAKVEVVVDVRALAMSRRRGFAKTALREGLTSAGIGYVHMPALGNPKEGREAAWAGDARWKHIFTRHLQNAESQTAVEALAKLASTEKVCLLCLEADPETCHRSIVAEVLAGRSGFKISHLKVTSSPNAKAA